MDMIKKIAAGILLCSSLLSAGGDIVPVAVQQEVQEVSVWSFEFAPYLAMSSISGDSAVISDQVSPFKLDFVDIVDALEFGVAGHFEGVHNSGWGFWIDYNYVSLGSSKDLSAIGRTVTVDVKQSVLEVMGMYRQSFEKTTVDYMVGIRRWNLKMDAELSGIPDRHDTDNDWVDGIVGVRVIYDIAPNWEVYVSGDVGAGASDFTASATAGVRYIFNDWLDLDIQYRGLWVDYETGTPNSIDYFKYDTCTYGPMLGLNFKF
jgi:hypothetical protein